MKARRVGNRSHVEHRELIQASRCFLRPIRRLGERRFGLRERGSQCRPNLEPQAIACEADVDVAVIVDERETMTPQIRVDALARHVEPRPHPRDAVALDRLRHAGQTRDAGAAQRLQQHRLGLVAPVMREQHQRHSVIRRHLAQRPIARLPCPRLDALAFRGTRGDEERHEANRPTAIGPASALRLSMRLPRIGVRAQAVIDMQREDLDALRGSGLRGRMKQRRGVAPAAVGDGDARRVHGACQRSVVSLKRP